MTSYPKEKVKILLLENINVEAVKSFTDSGYSNITQVKSALSEGELIKAIKGIHILGIRSKTHISDSVLSAADKLISIGCFCIGTNQVDLTSATRKGIAVFNAPYSNTRSVAELVIGAMIMLIRQIPVKNKAAHEGLWMKDANGSFELRGKTLGIIGYGNIGSQLSVLAESLGMQVMFYDVKKKLPLGNARAVNSLKELVSEADIVSIHTPTTVQTTGLINKALLKEFKPGAIFINYARGEIADINALNWAMENKILSGVALDVYPAEPEKNGEPFSCVLQNKGNVLLTPHIGGSTQEAQTNIGLDVSAKLISYLETGNTTGCHTVPKLSLPIQESTHRILHIHKNVPGVLSAINSELSRHNINIVGQYLKTNDEIGYAVLDVNKKLSKDAINLLDGVKETIKTRLLY